MNEKTIYCFLGFVLLLSSILMNFLFNDKQKIFLEFNNLLNNQQKLIYKNIIKERLAIYTFGLLLGLFFGILFLSKYKDNKYKICIFLVIVFSTKLSAY